MDKQKNKLSLIYGISGIVLQSMIFVVPFIAASLADRSEEVMSTTVANLVLCSFLVGTLLFCIGIGYYAKAKGHSALWFLAGFFGIFGFIVLALLSDRAVER